MAAEFHQRSTILFQTLPHVATVLWAPFVCFCRSFTPPSGRRPHSKQQTCAASVTRSVLMRPFLRPRRASCSSKPPRQRNSLRGDHPRFVPGGTAVRELGVDGGGCRLQAACARREKGRGQTGHEAQRQRADSCRIPELSSADFRGTWDKARPLSALVGRLVFCVPLLLQFSIFEQVTHTHTEEEDYLPAPSEEAHILLVRHDSDPPGSTEKAHSRFPAFSAASLLHFCRRPGFSR